LQLLVPLQDQIVEPEIQLQFFRALKLRDKSLKTYPTFYHESHNELGKEQVFEDIGGWIRSHS
jgi:alpha-beta hydrolase superfamily lysophospholipase